MEIRIRRETLTRWSKDFWMWYFVLSVVCVSGTILWLWGTAAIWFVIIMNGAVLLLLSGKVRIVIVEPYKPPRSSDCKKEGGQ